MSNLKQRVLVAVVAIPLVLFICLQGGVWFLCFVTLVSSVALSEFYALAAAKGAKPQKKLGILTGICISVSFYHQELQVALVGLFQSMGIAIPFPSQSQLLLIVLLIAIVILSLVELFRNAGTPLMNLAMTVLGVMYVSFFFGTLIGLRELFSSFDGPVLRHFVRVVGTSDDQIIYRSGGYTLIALFAMIWICDSAAFHVGMAVGKHKLFPRVSPNKSWEGAIAGFVFAVGSAVAAKYLVIGYLTLSQAIVVGCIVGIFGQIGDLIESLMKRDAGVKDSSTIIPGHGGAFDRFDSLLFVSPLVYVYIDFIVF